MAGHPYSARLAAGETGGRDKKAHPVRAVAFVTAIAAIGGFLFGYDTGVISGALLYIPDDFALTSFTTGAIVSGLLLGAMVGALVAGAAADKFGRRPTIAGAAVLFIVGIVVAITAPSVWILILGRLIIGLGVGAASDIVPLYISEVAPPALRGRLVSMSQLMITIGILVAYLVDYALSGDRAWRWMLGLGIVPATLLLVGMYFLPQSPRWLLARGRKEEAREVLIKLGQEELLEEELGEVEEAKALKHDWRQLLNIDLRKVLIIGIGLAVLQQVTGINTVIYYSPTILSDTGLGSSNAILSAMPIAVVNVAITILSLFFIDKVGRKKLLLISLTGMTISAALLGCAFVFDGASWMAVVGLVAYVASFAVGLGPVFWVLIAEIYPQRVRGEAMSVATGANWGANFAVALLFPVIVSALGESTSFFMFAIASVGAIVFTLRLVPETMGKSLEEIEAELIPAGT